MRFHHYSVRTVEADWGWFQRRGRPARWACSACMWWRPRATRRGATRRRSRGPR